MRNAVVIFFLSIVAIVSAKAQDLSEFDKKPPFNEVKTERYYQDIGLGDKEEHKDFEVTAYYGVDGELTSKTAIQGDFVINTEYTHEADKDGRITKRTKKETLTWGNNHPQPRTPQVWEYSYDQSGTTVVSKDEEDDQSKDEDPDPDKAIPIVETWKFDNSGKFLEYSKVFDDQSLKTVFEWDKDGKLLSKTVFSDSWVDSKEIYAYRSDGTLKASEEVTLAVNLTIKKQYDEQGQESSRQWLEDGKLTCQWVVERKSSNLTGGMTEAETTYKIYGASTDDMKRQVRCVVTTTRHR